MGYIARTGKAVGDSEASVVYSLLHLWVHCLHWKLVRACKGQGLHSKEGAVLQRSFSFRHVSYNLLLYLTLLGCIAFIFSMYRHVYYLYVHHCTDIMYAFGTFYALACVYHGVMVVLHM